ncbi:MAG: 2-C-methyl-D-erythritol 4-phosphate cytidylyltransferase [Chloroflexi bacterium]|nr:2-C-methyl-D-erythritol 4-phosphate cytidylyltransferase [Chloroflexota bacterium]
MATSEILESGSPGAELGVVVVAAGRSARMGGTDKTFANVHGVPLVVHTLRRIAGSGAVTRIALVVADEAVERARAMIAEYRIGKVVAVCAGGERRQDSVYAGLLALGDCRWVAVHDGARPCVSSDVMERGLEAVQRWSAAVAAVPVKDTIKVVGDDDVVTSTPERSTLWAAQTPQVFDYGLLMRAHRSASADYTDDAAMVEALGNSVRVFLGSYENLKVTTPEDLVLVSQLLADPGGDGAKS